MSHLQLHLQLLPAQVRALALLTRLITLLCHTLQLTLEAQHLRPQSMRMQRVFHHRTMCCGRYTMCKRCAVSRQGSDDSIQAEEDCASKAFTCILSSLSHLIFGCLKVCPPAGLVCLERCLKAGKALLGTCQLSL